MHRRRWIATGAFGAVLTLGGVVTVGQSSASVTGSDHGTADAADRLAHPTIAWNECATVVDPDERAGLWRCRSSGAARSDT